MYVCICIYIYIYREREREREVPRKSKMRPVFIIYIEIWQEGNPQTLETNINKAQVEVTIFKLEIVCLKLCKITHKLKSQFQLFFRMCKITYV